MADILKQEKLLLRVLHLINQKFKNQAILKGGIHLRLLNSPRYTQDIDFIFLPKISRKIIAKEIQAIFKNEEDIIIENIRMNSRGIFLDISAEGIIVKLEISIAKELNSPTEMQSTASLAQGLGIQPEIVTTLSKAEAFAHKIAAALERNVIRDLYDISILEPLTTFDKKTLRLRLSKLEIARKKPNSVSFFEAAGMLRKKADQLTQGHINESLSTMLPENYRVGAVDRIKSSVYRLCGVLEQM